MILIRREGLRIVVFESNQKREGDVEVVDTEHGIDIIKSMWADTIKEASTQESEAMEKLVLLMEKNK